MYHLHWCYTKPALLSANQNQVFFFMYIINQRILVFSSFRINFVEQSPLHK